MAVHLKFNSCVILCMRFLFLSNYNNIIIIYLPHHFLVATYDTQSIDITSTSGEVCVVCKFSTHDTAVGCEIQLQNITMTLSRRFDRDVNNIAEGCISNIISGYYDLYVYIKIMMLRMITH